MASIYLRRRFFESASRKRLSPPEELPTHQLQEMQPAVSLHGPGVGNSFVRKRLELLGSKKCN